MLLSGNGGCLPEGDTELTKKQVSLETRGRKEEMLG